MLGGGSLPHEPLCRALGLLLLFCGGFEGVLWVLIRVSCGGDHTGGMEVKSVIIPVIQVGISQDGTAGNAKLFMAMWDKVIAGGRFRYRCAMSSGAQTSWSNAPFWSKPAQHWSTRFECR